MTGLAVPGPVKIIWAGIYFGGILRWDVMRMRCRCSGSATHRHATVVFLGPQTWLNAKGFLTSTHLELRRIFLLKILLKDCAIARACSPVLTGKLGMGSELRSLDVGLTLLRLGVLSFLVRL